MKKTCSRLLCFLMVSLLLMSSVSAETLIYASENETVAASSGENETDADAQSNETTLSEGEGTVPNANSTLSNDSDEDPENETGPNAPSGNESTEGGSSSNLTDPEEEAGNGTATDEGSGNGTTPKTDDGNESQENISGGNETLENETLENESPNNETLENATEDNLTNTTALPLLMGPRLLGSIRDTDVAAIGDTGYPTLQDAVDAAADGDTVLLLKDVTENVTLDAKTLTLDLQSFSVSGGGAGSTLVINGGAVTVKNGTVRDAVAQAKGGGIHVSDGASVSLAGLTVSNNQSLNSANDSAYGGGILLEAGTSAVLTDCVLTGNLVKGSGWRLYSYGGGLCIESGATADLTGCTINANSATSGGSYINCWGAGVCILSGGKAKLTDCVISENTCPVSGGRGGGIYVDSGAEAILEDCQIRANNVNSSYGGAVYTEGTLRMKGGSVTDNTTGSYFRQGAIYAEEAAVLDIEGVEFTGHAGGAVYADEGGDKEIRLVNCLFSSPKNTGTRQVDVNGEVKILIDGCTFADAGVAIYANAQMNHNIEMTVKNTDIVKNTISSGGIVSLNIKVKALFENCKIADNTITATGTNYILLVGDDTAEVTLKNCEITGNDASKGNGCTVVTYGPLTLEDTVISDNNAAQVGGVMVTRGGSLEMTRSVITRNVASGVTNNYTSDSEGSAGGVSVVSYRGQGNFIFHSGAIYDNEQTSAYGDEALSNDVFVQGKSPNTQGRTARITVDIPASQMTDEGSDLTARKWWDAHGSYEDIPAATSDLHRYYTIKEEVDEYVAQVGDLKFMTIQEAVDAASAGDRVYLVSEHQVVTTEPFVVSKNIQLDLCGRRLRSNALSAADTLFTVQDGAALTLASSSDENFTGGGVIRGVVTVDEGSYLTVADAMRTTSFVHNGAALTLAEPLEAAAEISLGTGRFVTLGDAWKSAELAASQGLKLTLSAEDLAAVNANGAADHKIVENATEDFIAHVQVNGLTNMRTQKAHRENAIYLHQPHAVYLASSGQDAAGYGLDPSRPVKTFARAKTLLLSDPTLEGIFIVGTVTPAQGEVWEMPAGETRPIYRYKGFVLTSNTFTNNMIYVNNGDFTLRNIIIDGNKDQMTAGVTSMIKVNSGTLYIEEGTELRNNNAANPTFAHNGQHNVHGGAVLCESTSGRIVMNGGEIHDNEAFMGGGIFAGHGYYDGDGMKFIMNGGKIYNNRAVHYDELSRKFNNNANATGGGVMMAFGGYMEMNGGEIYGNSATWGGGIALGNRNDYYSQPGAYETYQMRRVTVNMKGGKIYDNTAIIGGGMFVQCYGLVNLYEGEITGNTAIDGANQPRGGGIYVNGRHGRDGVDDGVLMIHNPVEMTGNTADYRGHAIMTCATSLTFVRDIMGAAIHDNGDGDAQVAFTSQSGTTQGGVPMRLHSYLSEYMPGGGEYAWRFVSGRPALHEDLRDVRIPASVTTDKTASSPEMAAALDFVKVRINDNHTNAGGGAIGNNGSVFIGGAYVPRVDVHVAKTWDDAPIADERPDSVTLILTRTHGSETEDYLTAEVTPDAQGKWEYTFTEVPRYVPDPQSGEPTDEEYVYGIREEETESTGGVIYSAEAVRGTDTERPAREVTDPEFPIDPVKVLHFTLTNSLTEVPYTVEFYYQQDGAYPATPDSTDERSALPGTQARVTEADKTPQRNGYVLDEALNDFYSGVVASDGSLVLKVYFQPRFTVVYAPGEHGTWDAARETTSDLPYGHEMPGFTGNTDTEHEEGYLFDGWDTEIVETVTRDVTYTALWKPEQVDRSAKYRVEFYYQVKDKYPSKPDRTVERTGTIGETARVTANDRDPGKPDYVVDEAQPNVLVGVVTKDAVLTLKVFFKHQYAITYDPNGGHWEDGRTVPQTTYYYDYGAVITIRKAPERSGYTFTHWEGSKYYPGQKYTVRSSHTFTAMWKKVETPTPPTPTPPAPGPAPTPDPTPTVPVPTAQPPVAPAASPVPPSGDNSHTTLWLLAVMAALAGGGSAIAAKRRRK